MNKIICCLLISLLLSSCSPENQELVIMDSEKKFFRSPEVGPSYVLLTGIWEVKNDMIRDPHSVKIICDKDTGVCQFIETVIRIRNGYFLSADVRELPIKTWNNDKIIAAGNEGLCFFSILHIDLHTEKVVLKSKLRDNIGSLCEPLKSHSMPIVYELVDASQSAWNYLITLTKKEKP